MHRSVFRQSDVRGNAEKGIEKNERACYNQNKGAICAKEDKMKKLLATFAVTALLLILAVSAVSCVYLPDGDRTIDYGALGEPVFADEFDVFDASVWRAANDGVRRGGYWDMGQIEAVGGNLVITTEYIEDGTFGVGWYTGAIVSERQFDGGGYYAEVRCKMPAGAGHWGAFWLNSPDMTADGTGTEIDVVESAYYDDPKMGGKYRDTAFHTIHAYGYGDEHVSKQSPYYEVENGVYDSFNTYGVYWDGEGYKFFVNGMLTWETDFCPSGAAEYLELSVEIAGEYGSGDPSNPDNEFTWGGEIASNEGGNDFVSQFVIDYVRVYETDGIPFVK